MLVMPEYTLIQTQQFAFAAHIRDPDNVPIPSGIEPRRMAIYSELFFNNIESLLASNFPVIRTLYSTEAWRQLVRDFYRDHISHTPLFTEIGREFIRYLEARAEQGNNDPPFLIELAHYEWSELALSLDETEIIAIEHNPNVNVLEEIPIVSPLIRVLAYHFPVHCIRPDFRPLYADDQPTLILLVRNRNDAVTFHEIEPLTALLLERLQHNTTLTGAECLKQLLSELGRDADLSLYESGTAMLTELKAYHAILGTRTR